MVKEKKGNKIIWIVLIIAALFIFSKGGFNFMGALTGNEKVTRNIPSPAKASPSSTFQVSYVISGTSGKYFATVQDDLTGNCMFSTGEGDITQLKLTMPSTQSSTSTQTVKAPTSAGKCTFTGHYGFSPEEGIEPVLVNMPTVTVDICNDDCSNGAKECVGTALGSASYKVCGNPDTSDLCYEWGATTNCPSNQACQNGNCYCVAQNSYKCYNNEVYYYDSCDNVGTMKEDCVYNICQTDKCCSTNADTNCDKAVSETELLSYGSRWINNEISETELLKAGSVWVNSP